MRVAFRVDASAQIGTGHFMRCLTLANALTQRGVEVRFVCRHMPKHLRGLLLEKGMEYIGLVSDSALAVSGDLAHAAWLGVSQGQDADATRQALADKSWDWLVVDHYALDRCWEAVLRQSVRQIMVIDDLADRHHDCDMLLDQNYYAEMQTRYAGKLPAHCRLLLGPGYALLRDEFRQLRKKNQPRSGPVKRILVFFGGVDADNYTGKAIKALTESGVIGLQVDVVIGAQHPCREEIEAVCAAQGYVCHVQTSRMAELMAAADLAIGAGGTAVWERCCLGLPALSICVAANQQQQIVDAARLGWLYAPVMDGDLIEAIKRHAVALMGNDPLIQLISHNARNAVDGLGASRVASKLGCGGIDIRKAVNEDALNLFQWRNHSDIRSVSRNPEPIAWENHRKWFETVMFSQDKVLLIGESKGLPVGVVRFDQQQDGAEVSIYLVPDAIHSGQGHNLLLAAEYWLKRNHPEIKYIRACVLDGNKPSSRLFLGADYQLEATHYIKKL